MNIFQSSLIVLLGGVALCQPARGNGFAGVFNSFANQGVGGAGIAGGGITCPENKNRTITDPVSLNLNPALASEVPNQVSIAFGPNYQHQKFDTSQSSINRILTPQGGPVLPAHQHALKNKNPWFPSSFGGITHRVNDQIIVGTALTGFSWGGGGGFLRYKQNPISPAMPLIFKSFNLAAALMPFTVAVQPTPCQSYGASLILGFAGLQTNLPKPDNPFKETRGHNHLRMTEGMGARVGGKWNLSEYISTGLTVSSPVYFSKIDHYTDVLPHRLELPMQVGGGLTWHLLPTTDFLVDINGYFWKLSKISNKTPSHGGFGWRNTFVVMTGINHQINEMWTVRLGYQYSKTPVQKKFLFENAMAPAHAFIQNYLSTGVKVNITPCVALDGEISYGFKSRMKDPGTGPFNGFTEGVTMRASAVYALLGVTWSY